jgi:hypothetical protein
MLYAFTSDHLHFLQNGFDNYFSKQNFTKRVVLVFDEFDMALAHTSTTELLVSLRSYKVKQRTDSTALHVVVGVGTYQLQDLVEMEEV